MNVAVGLMDGLGLDGDWCIRVIPRQHVHMLQWFQVADSMANNFY